MTPGKIRCSKKGIVLSRAEERVSTQDGERSLYQYLSSVQGLGGFQDHFDWCVRRSFPFSYWPPSVIWPFSKPPCALGSPPGGSLTPTPSVGGSRCGWTRLTPAFSTSSSTTTSGRTTRTPSFIPRCCHYNMGLAGFKVACSSA